MKVSVRRVTALGIAAMLVTLLQPACGGGGSLREVQGAKFALNAKESDMAEHAEQAQPRDGAERCEFWRTAHQRAASAFRGSGLDGWTRAKEIEACPCVLDLDAKLNGDEIVGHLNCGGRAIQSARLWLTCAGCDLALPESGVSATTTTTGEARFDLSDLEVGRDFGRFNTKATITFRGDFESGRIWRKGTDYSAPGIPLIDPNVEVNVDLTKASRYATWKEQAGTAQQEQRRRSEAEVATLDGECSQGMGDSCIKLAWTYDLTAASSAGTARQQAEATSREYYRKACAVKVQAACTRLTAEDAARQQIAQERRGGASCTEATQCHRQCSKVEACLSQCTKRQMGCLSSGGSDQVCRSRADSCSSQCSRQEPSCSLRRCLQLDSACDGASTVAGNVSSASQAGGAPPPPQQQGASATAQNACFNECRNGLSGCMTKDSQDYDACVRSCRDNGCQSRCVEDAKKRQHACHERFDEGPCRSRCN